MRSALLDFGLHRVRDLLHRDLRVGLLALEVGLPDRLTDDELLQPKKVVVDRLGAIKLAAHEAYERRHPVGLARTPPCVDRLVRRKLTGMDAWRANDRILPNLRIVGQRLDVLGGFLFVLTILEQCAARRPEHGRAFAVRELWQGAEMQELRIIPARGHAQRCVEILEIKADALRFEGLFISGRVDAGVRGALEQNVRIRIGDDLFHQLQGLDRGLAGEVEQAFGRIGLRAHAVRNRHERTPAMGVERRAPGPRFRIHDLLRTCEELVPGCGRRIGQASLARDARMPGRADDIEEERPAIEIAIDGTFLANRRDDVVDHLLRYVIVPRLDDARLDEGRHFDERRLADIDVPRAFFILGLGDKALDAEALDWGDLIVDAGELGVHRRNAGMQVLNPLVEGWGQRSVTCERWRNA